MPPPEGEKFAFKATMLLREELVWNLRIMEWDGQQLTEERFQTLTKLVMNWLKLDATSWDVVLELLQPLYGSIYGEEERQALSWRLAASKARLKAGHRVRQEFVEYEEHWVPLLIEDCQYGLPGKKKEQRVKVWLRILGGPFAGMQFTQQWPIWYHTRDVAKEIGFPLYVKTHYRELTYMWLVGLLSLANPRFPSVVEVFGSSGAKLHNRDVRASRESDCPRGFEWLCHECTVGKLGTANSEGCPMATHPRTFTQSLCSNCRREDAWFDPGLRSVRCLRCATSEVRKRMEGRL